MNPGDLREFAPLKLNLFLHIVGRRADGYHLLESLFTFADFGDWLSCADPAAPLALSVSGPFAHQVPTDESNLVLKAARLLNADARGQLQLEKNIPAAAGLGGGSADAAAASRLFNRLWGLNLDNDALEKLALQLGADVPACIRSQPVFAGGTGEALSLVPNIAPLWLIVCNPLMPLPTPRVFQRYREAGPPFSAPLHGFPQPAAPWQDCRNDLTSAAITELPTMAAFLEFIAALPGAQVTRMSGSGASCFVSFDSQAEALEADAVLKLGWPEAWSVVTQVGAPHPLHSA